MENSFGPMVGHIREIGSMENNMGKEFMLLHKVQRNMWNGKRERESDGLEETKMNSELLISCIPILAIVNTSIYFINL